MLATLKNVFTTETVDPSLPMRQQPAVRALEEKLKPVRAERKQREQELHENKKRWDSNYRWRVDAQKEYSPTESFRAQVEFPRIQQALAQVLEEEEHLEAELKDTVVRLRPLIHSHKLKEVKRLVAELLPILRQAAPLNARLRAAHEELKQCVDYPLSAYSDVHMNSLGFDFQGQLNGDRVQDYERFLEREGLL